MEQKVEEGFQQFQEKTFYQYETKKYIQMIGAKSVHKNNNKMIYKSPLTIFYGTSLCELTADIQNIPNKLQNEPKKNCSQGLLDQEIQPIKQILPTNNKKLNNEQNIQEQERLNEYFPKKFMCIYNKFSQNLYLKNDLTTLIKNISKCIQLEMLISFKGYLTQHSQDQKNAQPQSLKKKNTQKKYINVSPIIKKNVQNQTQKSNKNLIKGNIHKNFDELRIRKTLLKSFYNSKNQNVEFFSNFESGNLHLAFTDKKNPQLFYLMLTNDINTHGCNQWFYFGVRVKDNRKCRFVILNISKDFKYEQQMKILCFSKGNWKRTRPYLCYKNKFFKYNGGNLISIDFQYEFNKEEKYEQSVQANQEVFFSFSYPYTYTKLLGFLKTLATKHFNKLFFTVESIGKTQLTNYIPVIRIESIGDNKVLPIKTKKPVILIVARQHASQTSSSFIVEQIIKKLKEEELQISEQLLMKYDFHIIPMANPDGVVHGNSRTNVKGYDINRCWQRGKSVFTRESAQTQCMNKYIQNLLQTKTIQYAIDLHSHSKDYGSFAYFSEKNQTSRLFSYFFCQKYKECRYNKCGVDLSYKKRQTFRGQMFYNLGIKNSITIQTSYYGYKKILDEQQDQKELIPFTLENYQNIAQSILNALSKIANLSKSSQKAKQINSIIQKWDMEAKRLKQKAKWKGQYESSNESDSAPQEDFLQVNQRKQLGQNINMPQISGIQKLQPKQKQPKQVSSRKQNKLFLTQSKIQTAQKDQAQVKNVRRSFSQLQREGSSWNDNHRKNKRKRIYTSTSIQKIVSVHEKPSSSLHNYQLSKKYDDLGKQLEKRSTLRKSLKLAQSKSLSYGAFSQHKRKIDNRKKKQGLEQQRTIIYPTACDINLSYTSIRAMHQNLHKNRIKVKDIKNQTLLRKFRNQDSFNFNKNNNQDLSHLKSTLAKLSQSFVSGSTIRKLQY